MCGSDVRATIACRRDAALLLCCCVEGIYGIEIDNWMQMHICRGWHLKNDYVLRTIVSYHITTARRWPIERGLSRDFTVRNWFLLLLLSSTSSNASELCSEFATHSTMLAIWLWNLLQIVPKLLGPKVLTVSNLPQILSEAASTLLSSILNLEYNRTAVLVRRVRTHEGCGGVGAMVMRTTCNYSGPT